MAFVRKIPCLATAFVKCQTKQVFSKRFLKCSTTLRAEMVDTPSSEVDPKIQDIATSIANLKLHEVADLNNTLKQMLNISDVPMMAASMAAPPVAQAQAEEEEVKAPERTEFSIKLTSFNPSTKIKLIKIVKSIKSDLNLVQAKKFVESLPQVLKEDVAKDECEEFKKQLEEAGGSVEIV